MINKFSNDWLAVTEWAGEERARLVQRLLTRVSELESESIRSKVELLDSLLALPDQESDLSEPELFGVAPPR